ncbi:MAG TPA: bifunctional serine/threonine-protein kinase/formylglycine-generating enzyme family protein [Pirellulales bacterium]
MSQTFDSLYATVLPDDLATPLPAGASAAGLAAPAADASGGRFEVVRLHASGGLGQVSIALDRELHRQVALKEIHPRLADQPESRARFLLEAEVTGSLEHPGVVPVYSLGQWPDGRPFYAMRLVQGDSLEDAIRRFHATPCDSDEHELRLRKLLRSFIDVCDAVDYAHSRGVLHRDLKPSNIMLGPYGETLVVDWGLAKTAARAESPLPAECAEPLLAPQSGSTPETRLGSAVGTPAFMSPEQAAGALDLLGPASDVYSLGATLYTLLTNRPAFEGDDFAAIRASILNGQFPPPRKVCPTAPRALEAVCLKAMALEPGDRYPSARALAVDIENWLGDAPVSARHDGGFERLARWARRHRTWTRAAAASLVMVTVIALAASWLVNRARLQTDEAHQQRALAQIELLCKAEPAAIPLILENLRPFRSEVMPRLRALRARGDLQAEERLRLDLALLEDDPTRLDDLVEALLACKHDDFPVLRDRLQPYAASFVERLWQTLHDEQGDAAVRFRAGLALAGYQPQSDHWTESDGVFLAKTLLTKGVDRQRELRTDLQPVGPRLLDELYRAFSDASSSEVRGAATAALAAWAGARPQLLAAAVSQADAEQFAVLLPTLQNEVASAHVAGAPEPTPAVIAALQAIVRSQPAADANEAQRVALGRSRAGAAIALLRINADAALAELCTPAEDPESTTQFIAGVRARGVPPETLTRCLATANNDSTRVALILALGEFQLSEFPATTTAALTEKINRWYQTDPSSAIHGACGWLLRAWGLSKQVHAFDRRPHSADRSPQRQWYIVQMDEAAAPGLDMTMMVFPAGEFWMGSPPSERDRQNQEAQHLVRLTRPFAMCDRLVSRGLFTRFVAETRGDEAARAYLESVAELSPSDMHPAVAVNWYDAVLLARWLTAASGMDECDQCYADPATLVPDAHGYPVDRQWPFFPERKGYRLPTEAEWEYACRAGTVTTFSFGSDQALAGGYGWFQGNSLGNLHQSAPLKPTGRGLVSMHGNSAEWCHDWLGFIPGGQGVDPTGAADGPCRTVRSGSYLSGVALSRSACRSGMPPEFAAPYGGVRLVRTLSDD